MNPQIKLPPGLRLPPGVTPEMVQEAIAKQRAEGKANRQAAQERMARKAAAREENRRRSIKGQQAARERLNKDQP